MTVDERNTSAPLVSVIIPAYNAETMLAATLESVLTQTYRRLEVLLVDDGSNDGTADVARRFAATDDRVRILSQANAGVARARNLGLAASTGSFIAWTDADDIWHPTKITRQMEVFRRAPEALSFVYSGYRLIDENDRILPNRRPLTDVSGHSICRQIASNFFSNTSSIVVPRSVMLSVGGHDPRLRDWKIEGAEDLLLQLQLTLRGPVGCCRSALVGYRMHGRNMSRGFARAARSNLKAIELVEELAPQVPPWVFREARARVVGYVGHLLRAGNVQAAAAVFGPIFREQPVRTVSMCARMSGHAFQEAVFGPAFADPAVGQSFLDADPDSAPWAPGMLMSSALLERLKNADRKIATQSHGTPVRSELPPRARMAVGADQNGLS